MKALLTYLYLLPILFLPWYIYTDDIRHYPYGYKELKIKQIHEILQEYPSISYKKAFAVIPCNYTPIFQTDDPNKKEFKDRFLETFIVTIPQGYIQSRYGLVTFDNIFIEELLWRHKKDHIYIRPIPTENITYIPERIATISQFVFFNFSHWMTEVLARLAMLEICNIEYDRLFVPQSTRFMKESLELWGINPEKIIAAEHDDIFIQANQVIVPSLMNVENFSDPVAYMHTPLTTYVKDKLLKAALKKGASIPLSKKVFISRKDCPQRSIINEDEIFDLLKKEGFVRYQLASLSLADQILLFHNAEMIIAEHGAGLTNILFCKENTTLVEIFQALEVYTFACMSRDLKMQYIPIKTIEFRKDYHNSQVTIPLEFINNFIMPKIHNAVKEG